MRCRRQRRETAAGGPSQASTMQHGDTVDFFPEPNSAPRAAIVTKKWSETMVNVQVVLDGTNERDPQFNEAERTRGMAWRTSVRYLEFGDSIDPTWRNFVMEREPVPHRRLKSS